jgi:hypothetical protein
LLGQAWEEICRRAMPEIQRGALKQLGPWRPPTRFWHGAEPEWDLVCDAVKGGRTLVGEARFSRQPYKGETLRHECARLASRALPPAASRRDIIRALFVPRVAPRTPHVIDAVHVVTLRDLLG